MAAQASKTETRQAPQAASTGRAEGGRKPTAKIKLLGFVAGLVLAEAAAAYFILPNPSAAQTAATTPEPQAATPQQAGLATTKSQAQAVPEATMDPTLAFGMAGIGNETEVDLGQFSVTAYQPTTEITLRIDFHLWGTVATDKQEEFKKAWNQSENRLRDQIITILRSAELGDLTDAGLGLIKRRILDKTNQTLGKPYLRTVVFSQFSFIEQ